MKPTLMFSNSYMYSIYHRENLNVYTDLTMCFTYLCISVLREIADAYLLINND